MWATMADETAGLHVVELKLESLIVWKGIRKGQQEYNCSRNPHCQMLC
jgi:hypothetical protein